MPKYVSPDLYNKYKNKILEMSPAIQYYEGTKVRRESSSLTDQEIADRLDLDVEDVTEIRCIAELELLPADSWVRSANWKREKTRKALGRR
ncbi:MAG: hypothetical protein HY695_36560 [Deltaproteobacteria bacterium]|nr:hypothetical protein [Deltaproteobacteria bacterium]